MSDQSHPNVVFILGDNVGWRDPVEEWDLIEKRLDCAWVFAPVAKRLGALHQSAAHFPNIEPGQEFTGYS